MSSTVPQPHMPTQGISHPKTSIKPGLPFLASSPISYSFLSPRFSPRFIICYPTILLLSPSSNPYPLCLHLHICSPSPSLRREAKCVCVVFFFFVSHDTLVGQEINLVGHEINLKGHDQNFVLNGIK